MRKRAISVTTLALAVAVVVAAVSLFVPPAATKVSGQAATRGWRVWVRTHPCSGRSDWIAVSQADPTGGGNFFAGYETVLPLANPNCSAPAPLGCTFEQATAAANSLRGHGKFLDYCCREYSVWKKADTGELTVVSGKLGNAGFGWAPVKSNLCCEEAEALAGKPGACGGGRYDGAAGNVTDASNCVRDFSVWENSQTGKRSVVLGKFGNAGFGWRFVKSSLCCKEAEALAGIPGACSGSKGVGVSAEQGFDRPGQDYRNFDLQAASPESCQAECAADPRCRSYVYVRPGQQGARARCWLKSGVPNPVPSACCVSGVKSGAQGGGVVYTGEGDTVGLIHKPQVEELPEDADLPAEKTNRERKPQVEELPEDAERPKPRVNDPTPDRPATRDADRPGSLKLVATEIQKNTADSNPYEGRVITYTRGATSASMQTRYDDPRNLSNALIRWNFSGAPGSLSPGQEFTITISGSVTRGAPFGAPPTAQVSSQGLEIVKAEPAVANTDAPFRGGTYVFRVPADASKVTISFRADYNIGTFATYRYEK